MKFITEFRVRPGCWQEAAERFLRSKGDPPAGVKLLGRWHNADMSGGYSLVEVENPAAAYAFAAEWSDILDQHSHLVVEDARLAVPWPFAMPPNSSSVLWNVIRKWVLP